MHIKLDDSFTETLGLIFQGEGLPRIAGRLLGVFVRDGGPFSFGELSERLQISRASVSTNTRLLEDLGVIERMTKPGERQDYFALAAEPYERLLERHYARASRAQDAIGRAAAGIDPTDSQARERINALSGFFGALLMANETAMDALRDSKDDARPSSKSAPKSDLLRSEQPC